MGDSTHMDGLDFSIDWIGMRARKLKERESAHESVNAHGTLRSSGKKAMDGWRRPRKRTEGEEALRQMIRRREAYEQSQSKLSAVFLSHSAAARHRHCNAQVRSRSAQRSAACAQACSTARRRVSAICIAFRRLLLFVLLYRVKWTSTQVSSVPF